MFEVLSWIVFGCLVGFIAQFLMPERDPNNVIVTILLGTVGAFVGGFIGKIVLNHSTRFSDTVNFSQPEFLANIAASVLGAVTLLVSYRLLTDKNIRT